MSSNDALKCQLKFSLVSLAIIVLILWVLRYKSLLFEYLIDFLVFLGALPEPLKTALLWGTSLGIQIGGVPIACLISMVVTFCYGSFTIAYSINLAACLAANYVILKLLPKEELSASDPATGYSGYLGSQLRSASESMPFLCGCLIRLLHVPDLVKAFVARRCGLTGLHLWVPLILVEALNVLLYTLLGLQVKSKAGLAEEKAFKDKSPIEQIVSVVVGILAVAQVCGIVFGIAYTSWQYRSFNSLNEAREGQVN